MSNTSNRTVHLKSLLVLEEKRVALQRQIDDIEEQISKISSQVLGQEPSAIAKIAKAAGKVVATGRSQRGALKEKIMAALESAGDAGVRVSELAENLGTKAANLHAWFHATAKRVPSIVKVAGGHYRLNGNGHKPAAAAAPAKAKGKPGRKPGAGRVKRGALSDNVMAVLSEAGAGGISIKDLSDKVGSNYRNVAVWFATTGKKNPKIKKVAPATYKLAA